LAANGIVATSQPLAAQAGLRILQAGGNAADAAVAAAATLNVVEPSMTGIGGDCFALYFDASTKQVSGLNGSGRSAAGLSIDLLRQEGHEDAMPVLGPHAVTVPGAAAGWSDTLERHGRMSLADVLAPAIRIAEEGYPVSHVISGQWRLSAELIASASPNGGEMLIDGRAPRAGDRFTNANLAGVFRELAEGGPDAFYGGRPGTAIADVLQQLGGVMTQDDLRAHHSTFDDPISTTYRGYRVYECAPNGQGLTALIALNIIEGYDLASMDRSSAQYLHTMIEAIRLAFADTRWYVADPEHANIPLDDLLSKEYATSRRNLIDDERAVVDPAVGAPVVAGDTVYISVVDGDGNACSFINSNYMGFGTGIVPQSCGFTLQNRGAGFRLDPSHPNALAPSKRPYHTIIPAMSTDSNGDLFACFGVMGGFMQPQGHMQVFANLVDHQLDPQAAVDAPRFCITDDPPNSTVYLEDGIPPETQRVLAAMGHPVESITDAARIGTPGKGQVIYRNPESGILWAGSDPRSDGAAVGY
jgi:gamma-glutamyltranspeptidase/glutathione hydrolase